MKIKQQLKRFEKSDLTNEKADSIRSNIPVQIMHGVEAYFIHLIKPKTGLRLTDAYIFCCAVGCQLFDENRAEFFALFERVKEVRIGKESNIKTPVYISDKLEKISDDIGEVNKRVTFFLVMWVGLKFISKNKIKFDTFK